MSSAHDEGREPVAWTASQRARAESFLPFHRAAPARDLAEALERLQAWRAQLEEFYRDWSADPSTRSVQCARGCSHCCTQMVYDVHPVEIESLGRWVRESGREAEIVAALQRRTEAFARARVECATRPGESSDDREERVALSFHAQRRPCVFLDEDGACRVHAIRPYACRRFFSYSDPEFCRAEHAGGPEHEAFFFEPDAQAESFLQALDARAAFDPESDRLDEALLRWLRERSPTT